MCTGNLVLFVTSFASTLHIPIALCSIDSVIQFNADSERVNKEILLDMNTIAGLPSPSEERMTYDRESTTSREV